MKASPARGGWRTGALVALGLLASCTGIPEAKPVRGPGGVLVESVFMEGEHRTERCLGELAKSLHDQPDGVLFFDRQDAKVRVTPPRGPSIESYHVHLLHRVGGDLLDHVVRQNDAGLIELDLSRFDQPEELVVLSSAYRFSKQEGSPSKEGPGREEEALTPPYAMSFKLVPVEQSELVMSLQPFRYVVETNLGNLSLFVQSFNRRDMLLTWVDSSKNLGAVIKEDPYIHLKRQDAYIPPRLLVDVLRGKGNLPWQRAGTWHLPPAPSRPQNGDELPFSFRVPGKELIAFGPPARVDFTMPEKPPATSARIDAKYAGVRAKDALRLVFAVHYPTGRAKETAFRIETQEVNATTEKGSFVADLSNQDPARFPMNAALLHRLVQPWRLHGGAYTPEKPLGTSTVSVGPGGGPGKIHARVVAPRYASHYDFLSFLGAGGKNSGDSITRAFSGAPGSPNVTPPPTGPVTPTPPVPPAGPPVPPTAPNGNTGTGLAGGGGAGGNPSNCGCGPGPAPGMPSPGCPSKNKCKGQCGQACPGNGHCKDDNGGHVNLEFPCPPKPKGCEKDRKKGECKCGSHPWDMNSAMSAVTALFPGAADYSWFGMHNGWAPCDETTPIGRVRISYWAAAGFGMVQVWCTVSATFGPCIGQDPVGGKRKDEEPEGPKYPPPPYQPGSGGSGGGYANASGGTTTFGLTATGATGPTTATITGFTGTGITTSTTLTGPNDPNTGVAVDRISDALGLNGPVSTGFLLYDQATLTAVLSGPATSIAEAYHAANQSTVANSMASADTELNLPFFLEGLLEAVGGGGTPGGSPPPGGIPPIPPGCGALGIEFVLGVSLLSALLRRISR